MTKKDFEAIAARFKAVNYAFNNTKWDDGYNVGLRTAVTAFMDAAEAANPRFNREMFFKACGF
jgi:hypothetical protein